MNRISNKPLSTLTLSLALLLSFSACSSKKETPAVLALQEIPSQTQRPNGESINSINADVTLSKAEILGKTYLYGGSLQSSSLIDGNFATALLSIALNHTPAKFKIIGETLQLSADQSINFESDANHPDRLIHEFAIVRQDENTVTIRITKGSVALGTMLFGPQAPNNRSNWLRSAEYVAADKLLMLESSIETADGSVAEFMETIMPREALVPANYKPVYDDVNLEESAQRYRFLSNGAVFINSPKDNSVRIQTAAANRFHLKNENDQIKWYVTRNVPEKYLVDVKNSIEAWNRYSQKMWGRDFIKFEGLLPQGVKIGDPRYNIVQWDTVQDAGAAYESQASDPTTGIQSHSLIYLPLAWINIGKEYWDNGKYSQQDTKEEKVARLTKLLKSKNLFGRSLPVHCIEDAMAHVNLKARTDSESFARELLKGVLFHEVGHALGLAHNFKGSLSFDPDDVHTVFTTSIMDYNHYNEEMGAFDSVDSAKGPLLEYDRQIISVLYNNGKDISNTDPIVPACNDAEADGKIGGVDPLCVRYDIGKDPTLQVQRMFQLLNDEKAQNHLMQSLPNALAATVAELGDASKIEDENALEQAIDRLNNSATGLLSMYLAGTANSLGYKAAQSVKTLYVYRPDVVLPKGITESQLRTNTIEAIKTIAAMEALPAASKAALDALIDSTRTWIRNTTLIRQLPEGKEKSDAVEAVLAPLKGINGIVEGTLLSSLRRRTLSAMTYSPSAPLFLGTNSDGTALDLESFAVDILEKGLSTKASGKDRSLQERIAYAGALVSFKKTEAGEAALARVKAAIAQEIKMASSARKREELRTLFAKLE